MNAEVKLFGSVQVTDHGRVLGPLGFGGRKPKQLLEILALRAGQHVPKDRLALLLWGEKPPANANGSLEHYVAMLRRRLAPSMSPHDSLIVTEHGGYRFDKGKAWVDVEAFDCVADRAAAGKADRQQMESALGWVRGDLLEDEPYAEWVLDARSHYRQRHVQLLITAAEGALADRDLVASSELAQLAVARDSLAESAYHVLMLAAYARGDQSEALRAFQRVRRVLAEELGIDPMPRTAELHRAMLSQAEAADLLPPSTRSEVTIALPRRVEVAAANDGPADQAGWRFHVVERRASETHGPNSRSGDTLASGLWTGGALGTDRGVETMRRRDQDLLSVAAVSAFVAQPSVPEGVARLTDLPPLHVAMLQERLCELGLLAIDGDGFSFVRQDERAVFRDTLSPARRRLLERAYRRTSAPRDRRHLKDLLPPDGDRRSPLPDRRAMTERIDSDPWRGGWSKQLAARAG